MPCPVENGDRASLLASFDAWKTIWENRIVVYRKSETRTSNLGSVTAWLRQGEIEAQKITTATYNADTFRNALLK